MSDELAERIKAVEQEHRERKRVEIELKNSGDRSNEFISGNAPEEYEKLKHLLKERAEEMNAVHGIVPPFVVNGSRIERGHVELDFFFQKPIVQSPGNALELSFGPLRSKTFMADSQPTRINRDHKAVPSGDFSRILWAGPWGTFTSAELVDRMLEELISYHRQHTPN